MRLSQTLLIILVLIVTLLTAVYFLAPSKREEAPVNAENVLMPASETASQSKAPEAHEAEEGHGENTAISPKAADAAGIMVEEAGSIAIHESVRLSGRVVLNQNATAQVKARFAGVVRSVNKGPGDAVKKDEVLATIESNESLQVYPVKSPLDGVVLSRGTNVGDVAGDQPMFTITNPAEIWAEFHVFPRDIDKVATGQRVFVTSFEGEHRGEATITTLLPIAESSSQTVVARVTLPNPDKVWRAGMTVRGDVVITEKQVGVAVKNSAIQRMEGKTVVFIQRGESYETRPIRAGLSDEQFTEVIEGVAAGERYVSENSFQIKANIGKAGAAHED